MLIFRSQINFFIFFEEPNKGSLKKGCEALRKAHIFSQQTLLLTPLGKKINEIPLPVDLARLVVLGVKCGGIAPYVIIMIASMETRGNMFSQPKPCKSCKPCNFSLQGLQGLGP